MTLVTDSTKQLFTHVDELQDLGLITDEEAGRLRDRINALEGDLQEMYDRDSEKITTAPEGAYEPESSEGPPHPHDTPDADDKAAEGKALSDVPTNRGTDADNL